MRVLTPDWETFISIRNGLKRPQTLIVRHSQSKLTIFLFTPLAYSLARLNRFDEATDTLKQALKYDSKQRGVYNNLSFAYVHGRQVHGEAIESGPPGNSAARSDGQGV